SPPRRIISVLIDPLFSTTRAVYVSWVDQAAPGLGALTIVRFRELDHQLAEPVVIVSDLQYPALADPQVALDQAGRIYVSLPDSQRPDPEWGHLLRFTPEGTIPWGSGQTSLALVPGHERPTALALDQRASRVWMAGQDDGEVSLRWLDIGCMD